MRVPCPAVPSSSTLFFIPFILKEGFISKVLGIGLFMCEEILKSYKLLRQSLQGQKD